MFVANPIDPSFPTIRYLNTLGPASPYPRYADLAASRRAGRHPQRGQLSAIGGIVLAAAAFGAGLLGGFTLGAPAPEVVHVDAHAMPGEFLVGPAR